MKEIVWVFGTSASGKNTFINTVQNYLEVISKLGWTDKKIAVCKASIDYIGQTLHDPIVNRREGILTETAKLLENNDLVLIKWQYVDTKARRPQKLKKLLPDARHRIIRLHASTEELVKRIAEKPWWDDHGKEEKAIKKELKAVDKHMSKLIADFEVINIDSSTNGKYSVIST